MSRPTLPSLGEGGPHDSDFSQAIYFEIANNVSEGCPPLPHLWKTRAKRGGCK